MTKPKNQITHGSTLVLKTHLFNDESVVSNSLQNEMADNNTIIVDISDKHSADFTDSEWDKILDTILSSSKVITI